MSKVYILNKNCKGLVGELRAGWKWNASRTAQDDYKGKFARHLRTSHHSRMMVQERKRPTSDHKG